MASFSYTVDTNPMAAEISSVSRHVAGTTTAVVAMQTAVVMAEGKAADHVCSNVNRGFFTLIQSQISQKMARLQSDVDSHLMQLNQQRKQLLAIKERMERDYNMISGRYVKLFSGLNQNLKQRIYELDRPAFNFAEREIERVSNRTKYLTATVPLSQLESLAAGQKILTSNIKFQGMKVIGSMTNFLSFMNNQKRLTERILLSNFHVENAEVSIPVIISENNFDKLDRKNLEIVLSEMQMNGLTKTLVKNTILQHVNELPWQQSAIDDDVKNEFNKILAKNNASERVKDLTIKMFLDNAYHQLYSPSV